MIYTPYFYIIQDTKTKKYYGGSNYSMVNLAHPDKLLKEYFTSSRYVQRLISRRPQDFVIRKIRAFKTEKEATEFETRFLTKVKAMTNELWYNRNEGFAPPPGRDRKHYNNGEKSIFISKDEIVPDGYVPGRLPYEYPKNRKKKSVEDAAKCGQNRNKKCYTDGKRNIYLFEEENIPFGFYKGTVAKSNSKTLKAANRRWYNNGSEEILTNNPNPGYVLGRLKGIPRNEKRKLS